jgi:hypothetical protein
MDKQQQHSGQSVSAADQCHIAHIQELLVDHNNSSCYKPTRQTLMLQQNAQFNLSSIFMKSINTNY